MTDVKGPVVKKTKKKIAVRPSAVMPMIQSRADKDHDGTLSRNELQEFFTQADLNQALVSQYRKLLLFQTAAAVLIIIVLATVTGLAVQLSKESHVNGSTFVGKDGNPVQCASKELAVAPDGKLKMKNQGNDVVIRTQALKIPSVSHPLNSKVPDKYLKQLVEFTAIVDGQTQYVRVSTFRRVIDVSFECGSYVLLSTNIGEFKLDTTHLYHNGGKVEVVGSFAKGRKLKAVDLVAFYDDVADIKFECNLVWQKKEAAVKKPSLPKLPMSFMAVNHYPCTAVVNEVPQDVCTSTIGGNARQTKPGANKGGESLIQVDHILVTEKLKITVSYLPNHPLQKKVTIVHNNTKEEYQLYLDSQVKYHCSETQNKDLFEFDMKSLHYLGVGTHDNVPVRKWAASMMDQKNRTRIPEAFKDEMGISDHSYLEFWDTDDANNYPYYAGMMDSDKTSRFTKAYYKHVKAGLSTKQVEDWVDLQLHGSFRNGTCRQSRNLFKKTDGSYIKIPVMGGPTTEKNGDVEFYVDQLSSTESVPSVAYQKPSYAGYWALATYGNKPQEKQPIALDKDLFDEQYEKCEGTPTDAEYKACFEDVAKIFKSDKNFTETPAVVVNSTRRRLGPTRTAPNCQKQTTSWRYYNGGRYRYVVKSSTTTSCISGCEPKVSNFGHNVNIPIPIEYENKVWVDGMTWTFGMSTSVSTKNQLAYTKKIRTRTRCYRYKDRESAKTSWKWVGWKRKKVTSYRPQRHDSHTTLWEQSRVTSKSHSARPVTSKSVTSTLAVTGLSRTLSASAFSQRLTASGSLTLTSIDFGKPKVSGRLQIEYAIGRHFCQTISGGGGGGKFIVEAFVGGGTTITPNDISLDIYGGLRGDIGGFYSYRGRCSCSDNPPLSRCNRGIGGDVEGKVYVKFYNMGCRKQTKVDLGAAFTISIGLAGIYSFRFEKDWKFVDGKNVGRKWNC